MTLTAEAPSQSSTGRDAEDQVVMSSAQPATPERASVTIPGEEIDAHRLYGTGQRPLTQTTAEFGRGATRDAGAQRTRREADIIAQPTRPSAVSAALTALQAVLRNAPDPEMWMESTRRLRAVSELERTRSRRHAALALLLADVLSFTQPEDFPDQEAARQALETGWRALSQSFVSGDTERQLMESLARAGWQFALPYRGWVAKAEG